MVRRAQHLSIRLLAAPAVARLHDELAVVRNGRQVHAPVLAASARGGEPPSVDLHVGVVEVGVCLRAQRRHVRGDQVSYGSEWMFLQSAAGLRP
jgi:hypothetical protein